MSCSLYTTRKNTNRTAIQCILLVLSYLVFFASTANAQSATLDQGANGKRTAPVSPADWVNGNLNINQAHFLEGYSIPLRAILSDLTVNKSYTIAIGYDVRSNGKNAMDYLTQYERYEPHGIFNHPVESVDPLLNIAGFPASYFTSIDTYPIPAPSSANADVPGMPAASFNALPADKRVFTAYNADITNITYAAEGALDQAAAETIVEITFTALTPTVVLAWGGHLAAAGDWGKDPLTGETHSASSINGSPYHTRLKYWIVDGVTISVGNQDKSVKTDAVYIPPIASAAGPLNACTATSFLTYTSTVDDQTGLTYLWSITGSNTAGAKIVDPTAANAQVVPIGSAFTIGTFNLQLIVTRDGFSDTCFINSDAAPGASVTIGEITANAGEDQSITDLETATLQASASGGSDTYSYSWSPAANLSNANTANPVFTPPSTGTFPFIVTATGQFGCTGTDTVVITVTRHVKPPCSVNGADPVCQGSTNTYTGPDTNVSAWLWSVSGGASIIGPNNTQSVAVKADNACGSYNLQLITTAANGIAKDTCTTLIQVKDSIAPVLSGAVANQTLSCSKDLPAIPQVTVTDNCDQNITVQYSQLISDSTRINKYTITRKWWATDVCGNTSDTMTQIIVVNDNVKPVITADFTKEINVQSLKDVPAIPSPTATDNCDDSIEPVYSEEGSGSACDSTIIRTWTFTDASGNSDSITQTIHIKDITAPVLAGSVSNIDLSCTKDIPAVTDITATDNADQNVVVQYSQTTSDSTAVNKYTLTRKWWATDVCGNTSDTMTQIIVVNDNVKPVITADFTREVNVQCLKEVPAAPAPSATDNCDESIQPVYSETGAGSACDSTITRTWTFTDASGNSGFVMQTIHIKDNTIPVLAGNVSNINISCAKDIPAAAEITATDNCDEQVAVQYSQITSDSISVNKYTLTRKWWATDACGNTSDTMTQVIVINDDVKPVITADFTGEINIQCLTDLPAAPTPTATDNCDESIQPVYTETGAGSACDSTITRTWTFTDASGNSDFVTQTIHIKDNTAPVLVGTAANANISCAKDIPAIANITATDNCDQHIAVQYSQTTSDSTAVNKYTLIRKWWATDACGNTSDVITQTIIVNDDIKPSITANFDKAINIQCLRDIPAVPAPVATDNCDESLQPVYTETGTGSACDSTITRTWTFTDASGNSDFVTQVIHIKDTIAPVLIGTTSNALTGSISTVYVSAPDKIPAPAIFDASDNCNGRLPARYDESIINRICADKYTVVRKWWAADACGNVSDTFTQVIVVNDDIKPVITANFEKEINIQCIQQVPAIPTPTAMDNSSGNIAAVYSEVTNGNTYDSTITRRWTFTDACGNNDFVTQTIHIKDITAPVLAGSVSNLDLSCAKEIPAPANITATDNCNQQVNVQYSQLTSDSTCINKYTLTRKWWAVDAAGNASDTISQVIKVHDDVKPVITAGFTKTIDVQCVKDIPAVPTPAATDNCDTNLQPVYTATGAGSACDSTITRTWTFTDACGNSDFVTQTIHIKDNIAPVLAGTVINTINVSSVYEIPEPAVFTASDNCSAKIPVQYAQTTTDSSCSGKLTLIRKWWAVDACGNASDTISQVININDNVKPVITASFEKNIVVACVNNIPSVTVPTAADNSHAAMKPLYTEQGAGTARDSAINRTWIFTDPCGNSSVVTQTIRIKDTTAPVIAASFTREISVQCLNDVPPAPAPTGTDNCNSALQPVYTVTGSGSACDSTITRKWTFTDASGNSDFITQMIHIKPSGVVTLLGSVKNMTVNSVAAIPAPQTMQATGNCGAATVHFSQRVTDSSCVNKFIITRKWWATDNCGYRSDTMIQTITVNDNITPVAARVGQDKTQACSTVPAFDEPVFTDNSQQALTVTYTDNYSSTNCPQVITRTWQATDACGNVTTVKQAIAIPCCDKSICTYTQRFYATPDTSVCVNGGDATTSRQIMISAMDKQAGDSTDFGIWAAGRFFTLQLADVSGDAIFEMLRGDGKPASLKGYATYMKPNTWNNVPLSDSRSNYGAIENRLLTQTMTLFFNISNSRRLAELRIAGDSLFTAKETYCGSGIAVNSVQAYILPRSVVTYLSATGDNTVQGLLNLANRALGGEFPADINAGNIAQAIEAINNGFDGCRILNGWGNSVAAPIVPVPTHTCAGTVQVVGVYPNPYTNKVYFRFIAPVTGVALLEVWNLLGDELLQIRKPVNQCSNEEILYNVPVPNRVPFAYRLSIGNTVIKKGIVISSK